MTTPDLQARYDELTKEIATLKKLKGGAERLIAEVDEFIKNIADLRAMDEVLATA